jgi:hypothetical protein
MADHADAGLRHDEIVELYVDVEGLTSSSYVAWIRAGRNMGSAVWWEQGYWLQRSGIEDQRSYRKDQHKAQALGRLAAYHELQDSWTRGLERRDGVRDVCLNNALVLPWMLHRVHWNPYH